MQWLGTQFIPGSRHRGERSISCAVGCAELKLVHRSNVWLVDRADSGHSPAMVLVPSGATAGAPLAAVGLPSAVSAPAEPMPCSGAPGAAENLPLYARAEPGGPGAAPDPGATAVVIGGGGADAPNAAEEPSFPGAPADPCARLPADVEPARPPLEDVAGSFT